MYIKFVWFFFSYHVLRTVILVQKKDWKTHRLVCKPVAVAASSDVASVRTQK